MLRKLFKNVQTTYALPLLLSLGILCLVYLASGLFPFGSKTLAWGDMKQQVLPFMIQFKDIAAGNAGLLLNMANAGGMNFWGVFLFFISSPFTALGLLVPRSGFYAFANVLVLLKVMLASCAATAFFSSRYAFFECEKWQAGLLGVLYAFGGFTLLYYQNVVWLDQLILFPLLMLCFNLLVQKGRVVPFALLLTAGIFGQFQIAYTVILAVLLSGGLHILFYVPKAQKRAAALHLGSAVLLAVGLSAVAWLPALFQYQQSARRGSFVDNLATSKLLAPVETTLLMLLCTSAVLGGLVFLLFRRRVKTPMVGYCVTCLCLFTIPLLLDPVNLVWHAGSYQAFPSRYGFIPLFFALMLVSAAFQNTAPANEAAKSKPEGVALAVSGLALYFFFLLHILLFYREQAGVYARSLWGNTESFAWALCCFALGGALFFLLLAARAKKYLNKRMFAVALCCFVAIEGLYNGLLYMGLPANETESFSMAMDLAGKLPESTGRVKFSRKYTDANNIGAMGYASVAHYSSLTRWDYMVAMKKMGYSGYWMEMSGLGGTTLTDHFLGINTIICQRDGIDPNYSEENTVYQNNWYALVNNPLVPNKLSGMVLQASPGAIATLPEGDRFYVQNWLAQNVYGGGENLFKRYEPTWLQNVNYEYNQAEGEYFAYGTAGQTGTFVYQIQVDEAETLYFDCFRYISSRLGEVVDDGFSISVNNIYIEGTYPNSGNNGLLNLGTFENQTVTVSIGLLRNEVMRSFGVYGVKQRQLEQVVQNVASIPLDVQTGGIKAFVQSEESSLLVLPIAYDEGFAALVNGEKVPVYKVLDGFMAVPLRQGGNSVELKFLPRGFAPGAIISLLLLAALLAAALRRAMQKKGGSPLAVAGSGVQTLAGRLALLLLWAAFIAALVAVYVLPIALWLGGERILVF